MPSLTRPQLVADTARRAWNESDLYQWLEDNSEQTKAFISVENARTVDCLGACQIETLAAQLRVPLRSSKRLRYPYRIGTWYYNLLENDTHLSGLWRRAKWETLKHGRDEWAPVLDVGALSDSEGVNWRFRGCNAIAPYRTGMIRLSEGGADAVALREFDLESCRFIPEGFRLPTARGGVAWYDADTLLVATTASGVATSAGYPAEIRACAAERPSRARCCFPWGRTILVPGRVVSTAGQIHYPTAPVVHRDGAVHGRAANRSKIFS